MITTNQKQTATANLKALMQKKPDLHAEYDEVTHTVLAFVTINGVPQFKAWMDSTDWIRRRIRMRQSSILDVWTVDPTAPNLRNKPTHAVIYDKQLDQFRPAVNLATVTYALLYFAAAQATDDAARCNLFRAKHGRMPTLADLDGVERIIIPGPTGADLDPAVADLLSRINSPGPSAGTENKTDPGTSQIRADSDSDPKTKQAQNSDRYHLSYRGKHSL